MATQVTLDPRRYAKLVAATGVASIQTRGEYRRLLAEMNKLLDKGEGNLTPEEDTLLGTLADLLEIFEQRTWPRRAASPTEMVAFLLEENGLKQQDLCDLLGASRGAVSDLVHGRRAISREHARKLGGRFRMDPRSFIAI